MSAAMSATPTDDLAFIGVDVGSTSARAGVFTASGRALGQHVEPIRTWRPRPDHVEQSGDDIWRAVCECVRRAVATSGPVRIGGIGFDATCSLVAVDADGAAVGVNEEGDDARNVIVWMDHRAEAQAARINAGGHDVLRYVGGRVSLEMQTPKLLWLAETLPDAFRRTALFFDLPDYLTWRACGSEARSLCSTVCKWTYLGHEQRWDDAYFRSIGLGMLADEGFSRIGRDVLPIGTPQGDGLGHAAAAELGLPVGTAIGTSAIDAHAGGIGTIGVTLPGNPGFDQRLALVGGTSSCHMTVSAEPRFVPGIWGPYFSAMVPGMWLNEAGQSAVGSLVDHVVQTHAAYAELKPEAGSIYAVLNERLASLARAEAVAHPALLAAGLHVDPDFHGNRSPRADSSLRGMISGLSLSAGPDDLARLYLATLQGLAYGTRHIIETLNATGYRIDTILASGGHNKNPLFLREHANATGCRIVLPEEPEAVLLGAAVLGAVAGGAYASVTEGMAAMTRAGRIIEPDPATRVFHDRKYQVFLRMTEDQLAYRALMT
ncbi:FGGY-family carbohydrate kinase [Lichenicoccus sp.]|uniref:FGGY-family carbohydrate kinase n=1 Tax=Lichenicoccus sp. TaxID=2781899 RepID=UPI003D11FA1B